MIDVLLATYKPNPVYLKAQVDSILAQKGVEVNLIQREDEKGEGACANFAALLELSRSEYVAFADQDDVWRLDKLSRELKLMKSLEKKYGKDTPLLVFSDARVVDANMNSMSESLFGYTKINPEHTQPRQLALQNVANGNTMLVNAALRDLAGPIPPCAVMHDAWVLLVASVFGKMAYLKEATLDYRQHEENVFGGKKVDWTYFVMRYRQGISVVRERLYMNIRQIEAFVERFGDKTPECFKALVGLDSKPYLVRVWTILRYRIFKNGLARILGTLLVV